MTETQDQTRAAGAPGGEAPTLDHIAKAVFDQAMPMYVADLTGRLIYANEEYGRIADIARGGTGATLTPGHLVPQHVDVVIRIAKLGEPQTTREIYTRGNDARHVASRHYPVRDRAGRIVAVAGMLNDVTRETAAVKATQHERRRFADIMRAASDWIWEIDRDHNFTFVSDRVTEMLGLPPIMVKGRAFASIGQFAPAGAPDMDALAALTERRPFRDARVTIAGPDGRERIFHLSGVPIFDEADVYRGFRGAGKDVTAELTAEQETRRAKIAVEEVLEELTAKNAQLEIALQRANAAAHAKSEFLATMSHELRTPLNAIIGFAELMQLQPFGNLDTRYAEYVTEIVKSGRHLLTLIVDCLDVSRIEGGALSISVAPVDVATVLAEARAMVEIRAADRNLDLTEVTAEPEVRLMVDSVRLKQILVNLLSNGIKFTAPGGRLGVEVRDGAADGNVEITVWDSGVGIPIEKQHLIFDRFQQIHDDILSRDNEGVGLGLTLSHEFARLMGGDLWLAGSDPGGSRFTLRLPRADAP